MAAHGASVYRSKSILLAKCKTALRPQCAWPHLMAHSWDKVHLLFTQHGLLADGNALVYLHCLNLPSIVELIRWTRRLEDLLVGEQEGRQESSLPTVGTSWTVKTIS